MTKPKKPTEKQAAASKAGKTPARTKAGSKLGQLEVMLRRPDGATLAQLSKALDWQSHSIRGAMSGALKKKRGLNSTASKEEGADRIYRIAG